MRRVIAVVLAALEAIDIYTDDRLDRLLRRRWVPGRGPRLGDCWAYARSQIPRTGPRR
jgi:hypothetical protein